MVSLLCDGSSNGSKAVSFKYVYIPCDASLPMEERVMTTTQAEVVGCLMGQCALSSHWHLHGSFCSKTCDMFLRIWCARTTGMQSFTARALQKMLSCQQTLNLPSLMYVPHHPTPPPSSENLRGHFAKAASLGGDKQRAVLFKQMEEQILKSGQKPEGEGCFCLMYSFLPRLARGRGIP